MTSDVYVALYIATTLWHTIGLIWVVMGCYGRKSDFADAEELKSKVYLLKHFERYIMDRLYGEYDYTFKDVGREKGMEWVQKYLRMKHVIVFKS